MVTYNAIIVLFFFFNICVVKNLKSDVYIVLGSLTPRFLSVSLRGS